MIAEYEQYLRVERCMRERSIKDYLLVASELSKVLDLTGQLDYKQINDVIKSLKDSLRWSQSTVYKYSICVRHLFRWLQRERYRPDNPYPFSEWRKPPRITPKFLTPEQFNQLIDDPHLSHQELTLLWLLWDSGARIGEVAALTQQHFDLEKKLVTIPYEISKGSYSCRIVPVSANCIEHLVKQFGFARRRGQEKAIFLGDDDQAMAVSGLQKTVTNIGMRQSPFRPIMHLSAHMLRHSAGIRWLSKGVPQVIVMKWLGHQTLQMTSQYINLDSESSKRIYDMYCMG